MQINEILLIDCVKVMRAVVYYKSHFYNTEAVSGVSVYVRDRNSVVASLLYLIDFICSFAAIYVARRTSAEREI